MPTSPQLLPILALAICAPLATATAQSADVWLEIGGTAGAGFSGACDLHGAGATRTVAIDGRVPYRRGFSARLVECELRSRGSGRLVVTLRTTRGNSINRAALSGPAGQVVRMSISR